MNRMKLAPILLILIFFVGGCSASKSGKVYSRDQARIQHTVQYGTVEKVELVDIEGNRTPIGVIAGGAAGAAVGNTIGDDSGRTIATIIGAILGGVAGSAVEKKVTEKSGLEITVKLEDGGTIAIVQEDDLMFQVGERVRVLTDPDGITRVKRM